MNTDCISRQAVIDSLYDWSNHSMTDAETWHLRQVIGDIKSMPSVTPQEPQTFEWCDTCKEYDQEKHCCHRWSKVIRDTVEEMKQEYIEREVLDKIRAEIERQEKWLMDAGYNQYNVDIALDAIKLVVDKCKAESEDKA